MPYIKDLTIETEVQDSDLLHVWNTEEEKDEAVSVEDLRKSFGSGISWSGTLAEYEEAASEIEDETVIHIYDSADEVTPGEAGVYYKLNGDIYKIVISSDGVLAIKISWAQYQNLTYAQKHDTSKIYFVYDKYSTNAEIDDTTTGADKVWSSSKINTEIGNKTDSVRGIIADEFDDEETYNEGAYCIYNGKLYKFNISHTGAWDSSDADETLVSDEFGEGGGGSVIDGSTITPTDNIQIWLKCAELTETYTTLSEVLADDDVMEKLFRSENASNYLVRSTTWATDIVADQTAMILIGKNDYCANKLLEDSAWSAAICNSIYFESVLNIKVPTLSGNSDKVIKSGETGTNYAWYPFDNNGETGWFNSQSTNNIYVGYDFTGQMKCYKVVLIKIKNASSNAKTYTEKIEGSNDGTNWTSLYDTTIAFTGSEIKENLSYVLSGTSYRYYRLSCYTSHEGLYVSNQVYSLQFYGRVPKTTIYSAANDIVSFVDDEGAKVVTTDATGKGEVTIVCKPNTDIMFTSSVAKDPDNLSENYSKVVTVKSSAEPVYVMPNKDVLYWYGYKGSNFENLSTANGWSASSPYNPEFYPPTENVNFIRCYHSSSLDGKIEGIGTKNSIITTKIHGIIKGYNLVSFYGGYASYASKQITSTNAIDGAQITNSEMKHLEFDFSTTAKYAVFSSTNNRGMDIYAFWYNSDDDDSKAEISAIGTNEDKPIASRDYVVGEHFYKDGSFCTVIASIAQGATFTLGTNYIEGDIAKYLSKELVFSASNMNVTANAVYDTNVSFNSVKKFDYLIITSTIDNAQMVTMIYKIINDGIPYGQYQAMRAMNSVYMQFVVFVSDGNIKVQLQVSGASNRIQTLKIVGVY